MKKIKKIEEKRDFTKLTQKFGISLITLVITIIVIIILAAVVVLSLNNNNVITNASSARYESDRDYVQSVLELAVQKVVLRHQGVIDLEVGPINTAAMNVNTTTGEVIWESEELAGLSGKIIFGEGTDTDTEFYTGEELPVYGSETIWYVDQYGKVVLQTAGKLYGAEEVPKEYISKTESYVGYYADVDGDGTVDGVIYADLAIGNTGDGQWGDYENGKYTIPKIGNVKEYYIVKKDNVDDFGTKDVITASGEGKERFYIMALDDVGTSTYCWYYAAYGNMNDYNDVTSGDFGKGKQNTEKMMKYWSEKKYGEQNNWDMWKLIQSEVEEGWFVPSRAEWAAFLEELGITWSNYRSFGIEYDYWSSSQFDTKCACRVSVILNYMEAMRVDYYYYVRLSKTF